MNGDYLKLIKSFERCRDRKEKRSKTERKDYKTLLSVDYKTCDECNPRSAILVKVLQSCVCCKHVCTCVCKCVHPRLLEMMDEAVDGAIRLKVVCVCLSAACIRYI